MCVAPMPPDLEAQWRAHTSFKGGHVCLKNGGYFGRPGVPSFEWPCPPLNWKIIRAWYWRYHQHINVLEARVIAQLTRDIVRQAASPRRLHFLVDSMICLFSFAKGRTSSRVLNIQVRETAACLLVGGHHAVLGFIRSPENPAVLPSREPEGCWLVHQ